MAEKTLDDGTFWLPSQFLTNDDDDTPFRNFKINNNTAALNLQNDDVASRAMFFPYMNSSPVESLMGSSETESDEEEHMAKLTRRMAHSTIQLGLNHHNHHHRTFASEQNPKGVFVTGSPQSTLSALGSSGRGSSPNGGVSKQRETWDLLWAAAGEVERMRLNYEEEEASLAAYGFLRNNNPSPIGFYTQQQQPPPPPSLSQHQLQQIAQFRMLRQQQQQQMAKQQQQGCSVWGCGGGSCSSQRQSNNNYQMVPNNRGRDKNDVVSGLSRSAWPLLPKQQQQQQQYGCGGGVRAVFLGNPCGKKGRNGTGVFLPRCVDTPTESRKKPACTTVLVPDRVAQALNLKLEGSVVGGYPQHQARFNGENVVASSAGVPRYRSNYYGFTQQKRNVRPQAPPLNHEIRLPQEWTY